MNTERSPECFDKSASKHQGRTHSYHHMTSCQQPNDILFDNRRLPHVVSYNTDPCRHCCTHKRLLRKKVIIKLLLLNLLLLLKSNVLEKWCAFINI